jgi:hypothetical protein
MATVESERTIVENSFGTVTSKRVIYFRAKGWFRGGSREDIPLQHVTSVRLDTARSLAAGILLLLIGLVLLAGDGGVKVVGLIVLALAALLLWGSPAVVVNTSGQDKNAARGFPWQRGEANTFVEALRQQLFQK